MPEGLDLKELRRLKLLILVSWKEEGKWDLCEPMQNHVGQLEILQPFFFKSAYLSFLNKISVKLSFFYVPLRALFYRKKFDVILSWPMQMGLFYGICNRMGVRPDHARHLLRDFHINLTRTDFAYRLRLILLRLAIKGIDFFLVTSRIEERIYSRMFNIKRERLRFLHEAPPNHYLTQKPIPTQDYILSYGNSDRDFDTLIAASAGMNRRVIILSQNYVSDQSLPEHIELISHRIGADELIELIAAARIVVLPLDDYRIAAGQLGMLETMALGRPLIVTTNMATEEYAVHKETAIFYEAKNERELNRQLRYLWENPKKGDAMGCLAREKSRSFGDMEMTIFYETLNYMQKKRQVKPA
jgi:glycosyltransferase involved in cell wall biosynthesis